jgi:hypothetical protein
VLVVGGGFALPGGIVTRELLEASRGKRMFLAGGATQFE